MSSYLILLITLLLLTYASSKNYGIGDIWQRNLNEYAESDGNYDELITEDDYKRNNVIDTEEKEPTDLRSKKSPVLCTVRKVLRTHPQDGYEYHPRHYHEYECVPAQQELENGITDQDICTLIECKTLERTLVFARQLIAPSTNCSLEPHEKPVKVGCNCIHHIKHHFL
ncbi:uncharacterized protein LOC130452690 [Diorhabda sublineata]|uniref:uncharacterized protein LOC130452690 n=1 Tax=Diorhabda sublineata TaxID=1163346 RepID=UPI0024E0DC06|nr:uncharacterized protein LOC130452690 [Diorhabda sublineata]